LQQNIAVTALAILAPTGKISPTQFTSCGIGQFRAIARLKMNGKEADGDLRSWYLN
jgi:hypothetical protein